MAPELITAASPWALLLGVIVAGLYSIMRGLLVPGATVDRLTLAWESRLADAQEEKSEWREAHRLEREIREKQGETLRESLEIARAAEDALKGFRQASAWAERERRGTQ